VTNTVPFPGGPTTAVNCNQKAVPVTSLGPNGTLTDTCCGSTEYPTGNRPPFDFGLIYRPKAVVKKDNVVRTDL
jgi:hypothetical protein